MTQNININNIPRDSTIDRPLTAALVGYVASIDSRVMATDGNVDIWEKAFSGAPFGLIRDTIDAWFLTYRNADYRPVIDPAQIRREARRQMEVEQLRNRALEPPAPKAKRRMPRHVLERFQAMGMLTDRDPTEYPA